ncbi:MAG TPA: hypothetical protein VLG47_04900 [Candidatus Saccharimonadales bacterium]|nr:hypothetical protein [Candidatus Saccharimonadales bacterium]
MKKQNGFSVVEGLLVLVIVGILGFTGWFVWHSQHSTNKLNTQSISDSQPVTSSKNSANKLKTNTSVNTNAQKYLEIKELHIRIPLTSPISDAYYTVSGYDKSGVIPEQVDLSLKSLKDTQCKAGGWSPSILFMYSTNESDPVTGELLTKKYGTDHKFGAYYYVVKNSIGVNNKNGCQSTPANQSKAIAAAAAFKDAINGFSGIPQVSQ